MATGDLAELNDVAVELGYENADGMSDVQKARAAALVPQVSSMFEDASERFFAPGTYTHRLRVQYRSLYERAHQTFIHLTEKPATVTEVKDEEGNVVPSDNWFVQGQDIILKSLAYPHHEGIWGMHGHRPYFVTVTYSHDNPVPPAVKQSVASVVARYVRLAEANAGIMPGVTSLGDALGNRMSFAEWATRSVQLLPEDLSVARRYRPVAPAMVVGT